MKKLKMARSKFKRRDSTIVRDNYIHDVYKEVVDELGDVSKFVSKFYIYNEISKRTKLTTRTISFILNHTKKEQIL